MQGTGSQSVPLLVQQVRADIVRRARDAVLVDSVILRKDEPGRIAMSRLITLVNTNQVKPAIAPIAFDYLHTPLVHAGYRAELLDLCFTGNVEEKIREYCRLNRPNFWGVTLRNTDDVYFSSGYSFLAKIKKIINLLRKYADVPVIIGGVGFSVMPEKILRYMNADYGVVCEGEVALPALLKSFDGIGHIQDIPGLVYWVGQDIVRNKIEHNQYVNLEKVNSHTRALVANEHYFKVGGQLGIETKRGCNRRCIYCVEPKVKGQRVRLRDPRHIVDEMQALVNRGLDVFHINDSEFNLSIRHPLSLCEEIRRRGLQKQMSWYAYGMPAPFPDHLAKAMRDAGCVGMNFGVDTASEKMLRILRRTFNRDDIGQAVKTAKRHNLEHIIELLFGAPGETRETIRETIEFIKQINPDRVSVTVGLRVFPGTELESMVRREGIHSGNKNLYGQIENNDDLIHPLFYLPAELGPDPMVYIAELIGDDSRFFGVNTEHFNYNANDALVDAIRQGERGAYWSILARIEKRWSHTDDARLPVERHEEMGRANAAWR